MDDNFVEDQKPPKRIVPPRHRSKAAQRASQKAPCGEAAPKERPPMPRLEDGVAREDLLYGPDGKLRSWEDISSDLVSVENEAKVPLEAKMAETEDMQGIWDRVQRYKLLDEVRCLGPDPEVEELFNEFDQEIKDRREAERVEEFITHMKHVMNTYKTMEVWGTRNAPPVGAPGVDAPPIGDPPVGAACEDSNE